MFTTRFHACVLQCRAGKFIALLIFSQQNYVNDRCRDTNKLLSTVSATSM